jgi:hypothetical protein
MMSVFMKTEMDVQLFIRASSPKYCIEIRGTLVETCEQADRHYLTEILCEERLMPLYYFCLV